MARLTSRYRLLLILLLLLAWAWRLHGLDTQSLWRDEVDTLRFATRPLTQVLANFTRPGENGPLYFLLLRPWLMVSGHSEFALRFPSALTGVLALPLIFVWGRRLFLPVVGLVAALMLAVNPYHVWYSQEAKMYSLVVVVVMLALWAFVRAVELGRFWRWLLWFVFTTMCFYIHVLAVLVIPLQIIWLLLVPRWRRRWLSYLMALLVLVGPYIPLVWWQWKLLVNPDFRSGHPFVSLQQLLTTLIVAQIQSIPQRPGVWIFVPAIFLLLAAIFLPSRWIRARQLTLTWWLLPPLGVFLISLLSPIFTDRYLIWTLPALSILLALGACTVYRRNRWLAWVLVGILVGYQLWAGWRETTEPIKSDFRAAAAYVANQRQPDDVTLFLIPYIRHTYQYYDPGIESESPEHAYPWFDAPYANREPDASLLPDTLRNETEGYSGVWLVESETSFYDNQGLTRAWLNANGKLIDEAHYARVSVFYYDLE